MRRGKGRGGEERGERREERGEERGELFPYFQLFADKLNLVSELYRTTNNRLTHKQAP